MPARASLQEAALRSERVASALRGLLDAIAPDLEIWDTVRMGQYAALLPCRTRRLLYADDLFSERYASMLQAELGSGGNPGGAFQRLLPGPAGRLLKSPHVHRPLLRIEQELVAGSEASLPHWFDATYLIDAGEAARLRARCPSASIGTLPPLLREPPPLRRRPGLMVQRFVFIGGFDYAPNLDGLGWFLRSCRDAVLERLPDVEIAVVGAGSERGLPAAAAWGPRVRFLGWVEDLDALLEDSVALLSPLQSGSGVKIKVLEAFARGLPVIATAAGVHGIERAEDSGCLIGQTPEQLAAAMRAACDPALNARLSAAARGAWQERYATSVTRQRYDEAFGLERAVH